MAFHISNEIWITPTSLVKMPPAEIPVSSYIPLRPGYNYNSHFPKASFHNPTALFLLNYLRNVQVYNRMPAILIARCHNISSRYQPGSGHNFPMPQHYNYFH